LGCASSTKWYCDTSSHYDIISNWQSTDCKHAEMWIDNQKIWEGRCLEELGPLELVCLNEPPELRLQPDEQFVQYFGCILTLENKLALIRKPHTFAREDGTKWTYADGCLTIIKPKE